MYSYVRSGEEFVVTQSSSSRITKLDSVPVTLDDGRTVIYWLESYDDGHGFRAQYVRFQEFDAAGHKIGVEQTLYANTDYNGYINNLSVSTLADGGYVLTWDERFSNSGWQDFIWAQRLDSEGNPVGERIEVDSAVDVSVYESAREAISVPTEDGGFVVLWKEGQGELVYRSFGADGTPTGEQTALFTPDTDTLYLYSPRTIELSDGSSLVFFFTRDGTETKVWGQSFGADGVPVGDLLELPANFRSADFTVLGNGNFVATWSEDSSIKTQIFDATGAPVSDPISVTPRQPLQAPSSAKVEALADGGFVVVWISKEEIRYGSYNQYSYRNGDVLAQVYDEDGNPVGELFRVNGDPANTQERFEVKATADGGFIVSWHEQNRIEAQIVRVGDPPVAESDHYTVETSGVLALDIDGVLSNDDQPRNYDLTAYTDSRTKHGTLFLERNGALTYVPDEGFVGTDKFRYIANDGNADSTPVTVTITVTEDEVFDRPVHEGTEVGERLVRPDLTGWRLEGLGGNDTLVGGSAVADILVGGEGNDTYEFGNSGTRVVEREGEGYDQVWVSVDYRVPDNIEEARLTFYTARVLIGNDQGCFLQGNEVDNVIIGGDNDDLIFGNVGLDRLVGGDGNDELRGGQHSDNLRGGDGDDTLEGGGGQDFVRGGAGADVFKFGSHWDFSTKTRDNNADRIIDFNQSEGDKIDLSEINGDEEGIEFGSFIFRGTAGYSGRGITGTPGEIYFATGVRTFLIGDVDGDRRTDFVLRFDESVTLTADDFIL